MIMKFKEFYPKIDQRAWIAPSADIIGDVEIGENSSIWFGCVLRADVNSIKIGKNTNVQDLAMIHTDTHTKTILGDNVTIGHKVMLHGCIIEDNSLIGMSATILDNVIIGEGSIVGANSLITQGKKFPPKSLIMGSPAKIVKQLTQEDIDGLIKHAKAYVEFKNDYC